MTFARWLPLRNHTGKITCVRGGVRGSGGGGGGGEDGAEHLVSGIMHSIVLKNPRKVYLPKP